MLVDSRVLLDQAQAGDYAVGAFNTYNLELTLGIIQGAEALHSPIILQVGASTFENVGECILSALALAAAKDASVPVAVHLDHARDLDVLEAAIKCGFTSVMFDGSALEFEENILQTRKAAAVAHAASISIEGELGPLAGEANDNADIPQQLLYTDQNQAFRFVEETAVDSLAVAIGNKHGFYKGEPRLDFDRLSEISKSIGIPLVLHGASGIPEDSIRKAIMLGICKVNVNTSLRKAFIDTMVASLQESRSSYDLSRAMRSSIEAVRDVVMKYILTFGSARIAH